MDFWASFSPSPLMVGRRNQNARIQTLLTVFLLLLSQTLTPTISSPLHSQPLFAQTPSPSPPSKPPQTPAAARLRQILLGILFGSVTGLALAVAFLFLLRLLFLYANHIPILRGPVVFTPQIPPKALQSALSGEMPATQLLGGGPNARYYKLALGNELTVAVKRLKYGDGGGGAEKRRIQRQLEMLARIKHRNMMSLRAYLWDSGQLSLVYDYMPAGSLEDAMKRVRSGQIRIGWDARSQIAMGVAKGLRYLHFECSPRILHNNLKPANVILDEGFEPRIDDIGLVKLPAAAAVAAAAAAASFDSTASAHYVAPECYQSSRYTDKSDVYSFGMILGVLLTGRDPANHFAVADEPGRGGGLLRWLRQLQQAGEIREALDKSILGEEGEEEEMVMAVRIALVCLSDLPTDRPSSDELVAMLAQLHRF